MYGKAGKSGKGFAAAGRSAPFPGGKGEAEDDRKVFVGNLPFSAEWQELKDHFGQCGTIEHAKVLTMDGKGGGSTKGRSRGKGLVIYSSAAEAKSAIAALNGSLMDGRPIEVDEWTRTEGKGGAGKGGAGKGGGWVWTPPAGGKAAGSSPYIASAPASHMVYVGNLPFQAEWQELKDHFEACGTVVDTKVHTTDGKGGGRTKGRSRGTGTVTFSSAAEAAQAIKMLNGSVMMDRQIVVDVWTGGKGKGK